jgi:azurin
MKKNIILFAFAAILITGCGGGEKKQNKEKFKYERTKESSENIPRNNPDDFKVTINSFDNMIYDKNKIEVISGKNIVLTLNHKGKVSKEFMGHNFVLLKKGINVDEYAKKAVLAKSNDYIPNSDETIVYTKMLGGGESTTISFSAPEAGIYTYICSFPGHYMVMRGELIVN